MLHEFALGAVASAGAVTSAANAGAIRFADLGLDPVIFRIGWFALRWYSLAYIAAIVLGWWYLSKLLKQPGAPMAQRHADDFVFYATLGIILGGRLGYIFFYKPEILQSPLDILKLWEGGMSFHGGLIGLIVAIALFARMHRLPLLRVADYITVVAPLGPLFVRPANFVNGELWGRVTDVPWAMIFPGAGPEPRHPSQLYEMLGEGAFVLALMAWLFFKTDARYYPGRLLGAGLLAYAAMRIPLELLRAPDAGFENLGWGLTMGQTLSVPMALLGLWLVITSKGRRTRVESFGGTASVA